MEIVKCRNGVGEWEVVSEMGMCETFDLRSEAEDCVRKIYMEMMLDTFLDHYGNWDRSHNPYEKTLEDYNWHFGEIFTEESLKTFKAMIKELRR